MEGGRGSLFLGEGRRSEGEGGGGGGGGVRVVGSGRKICNATAVSTKANHTARRQRSFSPHTS